MAKVALKDFGHWCYNPQPLFVVLRELAGPTLKYAKSAGSSDCVPRYLADIREGLCVGIRTADIIASLATHHQSRQ